MSSKRASHFRGDAEAAGQPQRLRGTTIVPTI